MRMHTDPLIEAFARARQVPPHDLAAAVMALPPVGTLPSPWATWTLVRLVRYRARQLWAHERLLDSRAAQDALAAVETVDYATTSHPLPDLPGWQLDLYGGYGLDFAYLRHRPSGEEIFLDLSSVNDGDGYFCMEVLIARRDRGPWGAAEARMAGLHPVRDSVLYAREELIELGYLEEYCFDENTEFYGGRLSPQVAALAEAVEGFAERWEDPTNRLWLAALVGDWPAAATAAESCGDAALALFTEARARECRRRRLGRLRTGSEESLGWRATACKLGALREESPREYTALVERLLAEQDWVTLRAMEFLAVHGEATWSPTIAAMFGAIDQGDRLLGHRLLRQCGRYLARHSYSSTAVIQMLATVEPLLDEAAFLALDYAPAEALPLLRSALRSPSGDVRENVAAALAVVDRPWSLRELVAVLEESDDQELTRGARLALLKSPEPGVRQVAERWQEAHRPRGNAGEAIPEAADEGIQSCMDELRDRALAWRARYPEDVTPIA
jgi:hypothetical protein